MGFPIRGETLRRLSSEKTKNCLTFVGGKKERKASKGDATKEKESENPNRPTKKGMAWDKEKGGTLSRGGNKSVSPQERSRKARGGGITGTGGKKGHQIYLGREKNTFLERGIKAVGGFTYIEGKGER